VVEEVRKGSGMQVSYDVEPVQNIALALNRAVRCVKGNFITFVYDKYPDKDWLINLYYTLKKYDAGGVLGDRSYLFSQKEHRFGIKKWVM
jgi:hypothetical protein